MHYETAAALLRRAVEELEQPQCAQDAQREAGRALLGHAAARYHATAAEAQAKLDAWNGKLDRLLEQLEAHTALTELGK